MGPLDNLQARLTRHQQNGSFSWPVALLIGLGALALVFLLFRLPYVIAVYQLYWSSDGIRRLFYEDLGFSEAWASFLGVVGAFVYALAWVPLTLWSFRLIAWRFNARQLAIAFTSWVFVYGHSPLLHALFATNACFNQRTGEPTKWYVELSDGTIVLYDSAGYDTATGTEKRSVTPGICTAYEKQRTNERPHKITSNINTIEFFDPATSRPRVWYAKSLDGNYTLYDARGFDPTTGTALQPITLQVVQDIRARAAALQEEQERRDADAKRKRQEQQDEDGRRRRDQDEAKRKAQQDELDRQKAQHQEQLEQQKKRYEQDHQLALQKQQQQEEWRRSHGGCNFPMHLQYFDCQHTNAPQCVHIGGNGGYACVP